MLVLIELQHWLWTHGIPAHFPTDFPSPSNDGEEVRVWADLPSGPGPTLRVRDGVVRWLPGKTLTAEDIREDTEAARQLIAWLSPPSGYRERWQRECVEKLGELEDCKAAYDRGDGIVLGRDTTWFDVRFVVNGSVVTYNRSTRPGAWAVLVLHGYKPTKDELDEFGAKARPNAA